MILKLERTEELVESILQSIEPWKIISSEIVDVYNYAIFYKIVVKNSRTKCYYTTTYQSNSDGCWPYDSEITLQKVIPLEKKVIVYENIE